MVIAGSGARVAGVERAVQAVVTFLRVSCRAATVQAGVKERAGAAVIAGDTCVERAIAVAIFAGETGPAGVPGLQAIGEHADSIDHAGVHWIVDAGTRGWIAAVQGAVQGVVAIGSLSRNAIAAEACVGFVPGARARVAVVAEAPVIDGAVDICALLRLAFTAWVLGMQRLWLHASPVDHAAVLGCELAAPGPWMAFVFGAVQVVRAHLTFSRNTVSALAAVSKGAGVSVCALHAVFHGREREFIRVGEA